MDFGQIGQSPGMVSKSTETSFLLKKRFRYSIDCSSTIIFSIVAIFFPYSRKFPTQEFLTCSRFIGSLKKKMMSAQVEGLIVIETVCVV